MSIEKVGFVGFRSVDLTGPRRVLEDGLELVPTDVADDQVGYALSDGTRLEAYSEANGFHSFFTTGPVVGFAVRDFERSWARLRSMGIQPLTDVQHDGRQKWIHFLLPDGTVVELIGGAPRPD